jgi:UDP-N-acetylglucosamine transferase subunit ALG13
VSARILVSVGTDHHPFDRVVGWADDWQRTHPADVVVIQHGTSAAPKVAQGAPLLDHDRLLDEMRRADVVVCHGGPATITEARRQGHLPICVPRDPKHGEHVDDHQQRFAHHLARGHLVAVAEDEAAFTRQVTRSVADPAAFRVPVIGAGSGELAPGVVRVGELIDQLLHPDRQGDVTVLYLGGQGRSGSTLLERAIGQLPSVVNVGEVVHLWERGVRDNELCGCGKPFNECEFWTAVGERAFGGWDTIDVDAVIRLRYGVDRNRYAPLLARPGLSSRYRTRHREYSELLSRLYRAIAGVAGTDVVVDSSKHGSYALLLAQVPGVDLRVTQVVRDSRAVAFAWTKRVERPESPGRYMPAYGPVKASLYWDAQNALLETVKVPHAVIRYEDFVAAPKDALLEVCALLGRHDPAELGFLDGNTLHLGTDHTVAGNPMRFAQGDLTIRSDEAWRTQMSPAQQRLVSALTLPLRGRYGYRRDTGRRTR